MTVGLEMKAKKHWIKYLPALTTALKKEGKFDQEIKESCQKAREVHTDLVLKGMGSAAAKEVVMNQYILLPPETAE